MQISRYEIPEMEAKERWTSLCKDIRENGGTEYDDTLKRCLYALSKGHQVLDLVDIMRQVPYNTLRQPMLAIIRADSKICYFHKRAKGGGCFSTRSFISGWRKASKADVSLPQGTFEPWLDSINSWNIPDATLSTVPPLIPTSVSKGRNMANYYVLWEVDRWTSLPPKDPLLLRRLGNTMFEVLEEWDLTDLEYAVLISSSL